MMHGTEAFLPLELTVLLTETTNHVSGKEVSTWLRHVYDSGERQEQWLRRLVLGPFLFGKQNEFSERWIKYCREVQLLGNGL